MRKILLATSNFPPVRGGSASVYANLAYRLSDRMMVLAPTRDYVDGLKIIGWREQDRHSTFKTIRIPLLRTTLAPPARLTQKWMIRLWDVGLRLRVLCQILRGVIAEGVRTVCIGELMSIGWLGPLLRFVPGVRTVMYIHGEEITTIKPEAPEHRRVRRNLLSTDRIIVVSGFTRDAVRTMIGAEADKRVVLLQNGVDSTRFAPGEKSELLQQVYRLGSDFVFVSVSRLVEKKGHDNTIRAFATVATRFPDTKLLIVGTGPYQQRLAEITAEYDLTGRVVFAGAVSDDDLASHYRLGDVFIMANRALPDGDTEGFGLVFLEANSCGIPVIAGKDGGSTEAVDHMVNGLVVDGCSVEAIASAMLALRSDPALRAQLKINGLSRAASSDWSQKAVVFERACLAP